MLQVCIFEDQGFKNLFPLTATRPACLLRLGIKDLASKILDFFPEAKIVIHCRKELEPLVKAATKYPVNQLADLDTFFINGRVLGGEAFGNILYLSNKKERLITYSEAPLIARLNQKSIRKLKLPDCLDLKFFKSYKLPEKSIELPVLNYFWDFLRANPSEINLDSRKTGLLGKHNSDINQIQMVAPHNIFIGKDVILKPGVVLDASSGAIFIDNNVEIMPNAVIMGPVYLGYQVKVKAGAKIYGGTTIGPTCKIGGEIEGCIIQGYSNKQHEGFLGHSFLGEWVNLGAGTENSDLKNTYREVSVLLRPDKEVSTLSQFVGCCIGDHTKTGIKTMINTGSSIGCFCNLFGAGYQPRFLPCFSWSDRDNNTITEHIPEKAIQTAKIAMSRRSINLSSPLEKVYWQIHKITAPYRKALKIK